MVNKVLTYLLTLYLSSASVFSQRLCIFALYGAIQMLLLLLRHIYIGCRLSTSTLDQNWPNLHPRGISATAELLVKQTVIVADSLERSILRARHATQLCGVEIILHAVLLPAFATLWAFILHCECWITSGGIMKTVYQQQKKDV